MLKAYKDYWLGYVDFRGRTSVAGYWFTVLANILVSIILSFILGFLAGILGAFIYDFQNTRFLALMLSFSCLCILPSLAIVIRRLRDAGKSWANIFWTFLPLAGSIILIVLLCQPSVPPTQAELAAAAKRKKPDLGRLRIPAAVLMLWCILSTVMNYIASNLTYGIVVYYDFTTWLAQLILLAFVIMIFIGKKNIGLLIPAALYLPLCVFWIIRGFSIYLLIYTATWIVTCLVIALAVFSKSMPVELNYLPAGMFLISAVFLFVLNIVRGGFSLNAVIYFIEDIVMALSFLFLGMALAKGPDKDKVPPVTYAYAHAHGGAAYGAYPQQPAYGQPPAYAPNAQYTASAPNAQFNPSAPNAPYAPSASNQRTEPGVLLVRFSIEKLNNLSGSYGYQSGYLIGKAVPPQLLQGMTISDGDSAGTLAGSEYVCVVSISSIDGSILRDKIQPLIISSPEICSNGAFPLTQVVSSSREPLVMNGVVRGDSIEGAGGWCANGMMTAWKEAAGRQ